MKNLQESKDLFSLLKEKAYIPGNFTLASGKTSNFYIDVRKVSLTNNGSFLIGKVISKYISNVTSCKNIAAEGIGGLSVGFSVLNVSDYTLSAIRKTPKQYGNSVNSNIENISHLKLNDEIVLLEDVITSGKSVLEAAKHIENAGFKVKAIVALVDRMEGGADLIENKGYDLSCVFTKNDFIKA